MATDKRERQRQNREAKKAAEEQASKRQQRWRMVRKYAIYAAIFIAAIVALRLFVG
jgi:hypothetical protein